MKTFNDITKTKRVSKFEITYDFWCEMLDDIGNQLLIEERLEEQEWWDKMSPDEQEKYIKDHPKSKQAKQAKEKEKGQTGDETQTDDKPKDPDSFEAKEKELTDAGASKEDIEQTKNIYNGVKEHIGEVTKSVGVSTKEAVEAFKQPNVYNVLKGVGFSAKALGQTALGSMKTIKVALDGVSANLADTAPFKALKNGTMKADEFLNKNPSLKRITGVAVAGFATYQWLNMSFSGDIESDYDLSTVSDALRGDYSLTDVLSSPSGITGLGLLAAGLATGGLPIWMGGAKGVTMALAYGGFKSAGKLKEANKLKNEMVSMNATETDNKKESFTNFYTDIVEKEDHKKSKEYKRLSPKMKDAVDDIFRIMDSKPSDFLNTFDKTITATSKKYRVPEKELLKYFEREMLTI